MARSGKLRILIVDDSTETREYLRKLLAFEQNIEIVGTAGNGKQAVKVALETKPDLVLMDINMPEMDGITAADILFGELPSVRVVMMSVQSEMAYLRRAMQVGAREFLIKPFTHEQLLDILGEVGSLGPAPGSGQVAAEAVVETQSAEVQNLAALVAVFSPRGGAGCSTLALNLALALQGQRSAQALLIDGNLRFGALDAMLNLQVSHSITDLLPVLDDADSELLHETTLVHTSGIRLLAAPATPEMADLVSTSHLEHIVGLAQERYDYVVADIGTSLDDRALYFMDEADIIYVLLTPDIPAVKNVRLFLDIAQSLEYGPDKVKLVLNRANPKGGITAEAIQRHLRSPIVATLPESPRLVQAAINRGVPLMLFEREVDKQMSLTRQLLALADMVPETGRAVPRARKARAASAEPEQPPAPITRRAKPKPKPKRGFFSRLLGRP
jgi:pilus assembly protein CpaE